MTWDQWCFCVSIGKNTSIFSFYKTWACFILIYLSPSNLLTSSPNPSHLSASSNQDIDPAYSEADHTPTETDYYYTVEEEASPQPESDLTGYEETINQVTHTHRYLRDMELKTVSQLL